MQPLTARYPAKASAGAQLARIRTATVCRPGPLLPDHLRSAARPDAAIALCRLRYDQTTRAYLHRRSSEGLSKQEILRCLKRYIDRDVYTTLRADFAALTP